MKTWRALNEKEIKTKMFDTPKYILLNKNVECVFPTQKWKLWIPDLLEHGVFKDMNYRNLLVTNETKILEEEYHHHNIPHVDLDQMANNIYL